MRTYRVTRAAELIGVSATTLRRYTQLGKIKDTRNPAGQRVFTQASIDEFLGKPVGEQKLAFYVRSSDGDQVKIDNQIDLLTKAYGEPVRIFKDKASGLNEKRQGLQALLNNAERGNLTKVAITQKDRLTRFGYSYLERLLKVYGVELVVFGEDTQKNIHEELLQDFMSLLASFSGKFYRLRGYEQQEQLLVKAGETLEEKKR
jgi:putative resolvase